MLRKNFGAYRQREDDTVPHPIPQSSYQNYRNNDTAFTEATEQMIPEPQYCDVFPKINKENDDKNKLRQEYEAMGEEIDRLFARIGKLKALRSSIEEQISDS